MVGRQGGLAEKIRSHWVWAIPLPAALDSSSAGPLLCAGATVFSPLVTFGVKPTERAALLKTLKPNGRMVLVGAVLEPMQISAMDLILGQKSVSGLLNAGPAATSDMLEFAAPHKIAPQVEHFPMSQSERRA